MTYSEKLKDPRWHRFAQEVRSHHNEACRGCGDKGNGLIVHHLRYIDGLEPWEYPMKLMVLLCYECNIGAHQEEYADVMASGGTWGRMAREKEIISSDAELG